MDTQSARTTVEMKQAIAGSQQELHISLLGGFHLLQDSQSFGPESFRLRKACTLIKLLALAPGHRLLRDQLLEWLWPDGDPQSQANSLHQALRSARQVMENLHPPCFVRFEGDLIYLQSDAPLHVDVEDFEAAATQARRSQELSLYQSALALYTGELLPEDRYEEWAIQPREALQQAYRSLLIDLASLHEGLGEFQPALVVYQRLINLDPLLEDAHTGLMRTYALSRQRSQALRQYQILQETLSRELGTEPDPATQKLFQQIQAGSYPPPDFQSHARLPDFPAKKVKNHNLPIQLTSFIGREQEIATVVELLAKHRLVTLTGSGGTGKTRLSLRVAGDLLEQFPNGVWLVELAGLGDPDLVPRTTIAALGLQESASKSLMSQLEDFLKEKQLLLVLDNCEHVIEDCSRMAEGLVRACPRLTILASSREALGVAGEAAYQVPSLSSPDPRRLPPVEELENFTAVQLFVERTASAQPGFTITPANAAAVAQICHRLDGIPLAIELAAARVSVLGVEGIASRLDSRFRLLTGGSRTALPRQQTLRASIDWSYSLLNELERLLLLRLSVFFAGWTLEAASAVCGYEGLDEFEVIDILAQLANKSLIVVESDAGGQNRYRMLETIRQYAREKLLDSDLSSVVRDHHLDYFTHLAGTAKPHLRGPQQVEWLDRLEMEIDNLRAAMEWALEGEVRKGLRLATDVFWLWHIRGYRVEAEQWIEQLFEGLRVKPPGKDDLSLLAEARVQQGLLMMASGRVEARATCIIDEAMALAEQLGEDGKHLQIGAIHAMAWNARYSGQNTREHTLNQKAIRMAEEIGDRFLQAEILMALQDSEPDQAKSLQYAELHLALRRELGDLDGLIMAYAILGSHQMRFRNLPQAFTMYEESFRLARELKNRWGILTSLYNLGVIHFEIGNIDLSNDYHQQSLEASKDYGEPVWTVGSLNTLGHTSEVYGDWSSTQQYFLQAIELTRVHRFTIWEVRSCINLAEKAWNRGDYPLAEQYYQAAIVANQNEEASEPDGLIAYVHGKVALMHKDQQAANFFRKALEESMRQGDLIIAQCCLEVFSMMVAAEPGQAARAVRLKAAADCRQRPQYDWRAMRYLAPFDLEAMVAPLQAELGEQEYARLYAEGKALTLEQAVELALQETPSADLILNGAHHAEGGSSSPHDEP